MATDPRVIHAYRHLLRGLLHAVQFSKPARFVALSRLRAGFREPDAKFDPRSAARTVRFLQAAARQRGLEHKVLRNLLLTSYHRYHQIAPWKVTVIEAKLKPKRTDLEAYIEDTAYQHYDTTVSMLNKSLGLCLR